MFYLITIDVYLIDDPTICRLREGKRAAANKDWDEELHWTICTSDWKSIVLLFLPIINTTSTCSFCPGLVLFKTSIVYTLYFVFQNRFLETRFTVMKAIFQILSFVKCPVCNGCPKLCLAPDFSLRPNFFEAKTPLGNNLSCKRSNVRNSRNILKK